VIADDERRRDQKLHLLMTYCRSLHVAGSTMCAAVKIVGRAIEQLAIQLARCCRRRIARPGRSRPRKVLLPANVRMAW
jgi:hypothetical protein